MVIAVEYIVDEDSLKAWLNERPEDLRQQCSVWMAARAAARAIPKDWYGQHFDKRARERGLNGVWVSRCLLIAIAAMLCPQENFQDPKYVALAQSYGNNAFFISSSAPPAVGVASSSDVESQMAYLIWAVTPHGELKDAVYARNFYSAGSQGASSFERAYGKKEIFALPRVDCQLWLELETSGDIDIVRLQSAPLWPDENPLASEWADLKAKLIEDATSDDPHSADWSFWIDWYDGLLEGRAQNIDMLFEIATTDKINWEATPREVNEAIADIVDGYKELELVPTPLSKATLFDFELANDKLRLVGFPKDLDQITSSDTIVSFLKDTEALRVDLVDWIDYAEDEIRERNVNTPLLKAVMKLERELSKVKDSKAINLRRLVSLGGDVRRFSIDTGHRDAVGEALADLLDQRMGTYAQIASDYFGPIFSLLEPLRLLELGELKPSDLVVMIKTALARLDAQSEASYIKLDDPSRAVLNELVRELEEIEAEVEGLPEGKKVEVLRKKFAEKFGGMVNTAGQMFKKATPHYRTVNAAADELIKSHKRVEDLEGLVEFLKGLINYSV